jgi:hypothetical protein
MGCYGDTVSDRALSVWINNSSSAYNSNDQCIRECTRQGYMFAGTEVNELRASQLECFTAIILRLKRAFYMQGSSECHCGNNYDYDKHGESEGCTKECNGETNQTCGGDWAIQIYSGSLILVG